MPDGTGPRSERLTVEMSAHAALVEQLKQQNSLIAVQARRLDELKSRVDQHLADDHDH